MPVDEALFYKAQSGDRQARDKIFCQNEGLIWACIRRYAGLLEQDDLYQLASIGLLKAVQRFDPRYGTTFSTFAVPHILGEIRRHLRDNTPVKIERRYKDLVFQIRKADRELRERTGSEATLQDIASHLGVAVDLVVESLDATKPPVYLEDLPSWMERQAIGTGDAREHDLLPDAIDIRRALAGLGPQEKSVIIERFFRGRTQAQIASRLGVSQAQVSRLEKRALLTLRSALKD